MSQLQPAFYTRTGSVAGDLMSLMHWPYTLWHLSYVVIGAALAPDIDAVILSGTVLAFLFGLGIGAHALDELHDRPLGTRLSPSILRVLGWGGLVVGGGGLAVAGAILVSPWSLIWGAVGILLVATYTLEWVNWVHSDLGFAVAWGAFPVMAGYWAQAESIGLPVIVIAAAATALSMAQRDLSTPARHVRRRTREASAVVGDENWDRQRLLDSWERPLRSLAIAHVLLAVALVLTHVV